MDLSFFRFLPFLAASCLIVPAGYSATIYSNLSSLSAVSGEVVGVDAPNTYEIADTFVPSQSYLFTMATVSVKRDTGSAPLVANLWSNAGGSPGVILDSATVAAASIPTSRATVNFTFAGGVTLQANTTYWFSLTSTASTDYVWTTSNATTYPEKYRINSGAWNGPTSPMSAFEVDGTPVAGVPEPSPVVGLLGSLTVACLVSRRRTGFGEARKSR